jgi:hypothetical protein
MHQIHVYLPESHLDIVKQAMFDAGAGRYKAYDSCCWQTSGEGQFRALDNAKPFIGEKNTLTHEKEYRVEMVCEDRYLIDVIEALKKAHPYEEPAFAYYPINLSLL